MPTSPPRIFSVDHLLTYIYFSWRRRMNTPLSPGSSGEKAWKFSSGRCVGYGWILSLDKRYLPGVLESLKELAGQSRSSRKVQYEFRM